MGVTIATERCVGYQQSALLVACWWSIWPPRGRIWQSLSAVLGDVFSLDIHGWRRFLRKKSLGRLKDPWQKALWNYRSMVWRQMGKFIENGWEDFAPTKIENDVFWNESCFDWKGGVHDYQVFFEDNRYGTVPIARFLVHFTWLHQVSFQHFLRNDACWSACVYSKTMLYKSCCESTAMSWPHGYSNYVYCNSLFVCLYSIICTKSVYLFCT